MGWFVSLARAFGRIPGTVRGPLWMVISAIVFSFMIVVVRHVSTGIHPFEIAMFRYVFGLAALLPLMMAEGRRSFRTRRLGMHVFRALSAVGVVLSFFAAVSWMPLAEATALSFTSPFFTTLGAALFLGESVGPRRWTMVVVGFAGAMVILRPGLEAVTPPALLALASAFFLSTGAMAVKSLSRTDSTNTIVFYQSVLASGFAGLAAAFVWTWPSLPALGWLALTGVLATLGHQAYVRAYAAADAALVVAYDFSRLIFTAILSFVLFAEQPDVWTWVGAGLIFAATLHSLQREAQAAVRQPRNGGGPGPT